MFINEIILNGKYFSKDGYQCTVENFLSGDAAARRTFILGFINGAIRKIKEITGLGAQNEIADGGIDGLIAGMAYQNGPTPLFFKMSQDFVTALTVFKTKYGGGNIDTRSRLFEGANGHNQPATAATILKNYLKYAFGNTAPQATLNILTKIVVADVTV